MADAEVIEGSKRGPGKVAQLRMVPFTLELPDYDDRDNDFMLGEASKRGWIC